MKTIAVKAWLGATLLLALCLPPLSVAAEEKRIVEQREVFVAAEKALLRGDLSLYEKLKVKLQHYPLLPYLEYTHLRRYLSHAKHEEINRFIDLYPNTHLAKRLRSHYLKLLAKKRNWQTYIDSYQFTDDVEENCNYQLALYNTGYEKIALNAAAAIWTHPESLPKNCDTLFEHWFAAGGPSADTVWQRFELAINAREFHLAKYLQRFMPEKDQALANRWRGLRRNPLSVLRKEVPAKAHLYHDKARLYAALQTARLAPDRLDEVWHKIMPLAQQDSELVNQTINNIALVLARKHHPAARSWFEKASISGREPVYNEWYLRSLLREQNWHTLLYAIDALPSEQKRASQWRYWKARAHEKLGQHKVSQELYAEVAQLRSYYGFLAADKLQRSYSYNTELLKFTQTEIDTFEEVDAIKRIKELIALERNTDARREWYNLLPQLDNRSLQKFAMLLHQWGSHNQAILTIARTDHKDDLALRFPLLHQDAIEKYAAKRDLNPMLIYAMIRQESAYNAGARSHAGARGLMQLMPATAKSVAKTLGLKLRKQNQLYNPDFNIALGTSYIAQMLSRFDDNTILATAAYNAGPHRVKRWLPESRQLPADVWVETIPFNETRNYVKNIHAYIAVYNYRLGNSPVVISQNMKPVGPELTARTTNSKFIAGTIAVMPVSN